MVIRSHLLSFCTIPTPACSTTESSTIPNGVKFLAVIQVLGFIFDC